MASPIETVASFLGEGANGKESMMNAFRTYFMPNTVWELVGSSRTIGAEAAIALMQEVQSSYDMDCLVSEILSVANRGNKALTEWIAKICATSIGYLVSVPA